MTKEKQNPKSHHPENKTIATVTILVLLSLSFIIYMIPNVKGVVTNPSIQFTNQNSCTGCGASQDEFSLIQVGNGFNPATVIGQGLLNVVYCSGSTTTTLPDVSSITDTIGNTWTKIASVGNGAVGTNDNAQIQYMNSIWQTNVVTTGSASFRITINFSPNAGNCKFILFLDTTGFLISASFGGSYQYFKPSHGIFASQPKLNSIMSTQSIPTPQGAIVFSSDWLNSTQTDGLTATQQNNLGLQYLTSLNLGGGNSYLYVRDFYGYYSGTQPSTIYKTSWISSSSIPNSNYPIGQLVVLLQSTTLNPTNCNPNCMISGGGTISNTVFSLTANTTYYYVSETGIGGITLNNISSKISSYVNNGVGKSNDTFQITIYQSACTSGGVPIFSLTCPYTNFGLFTFTKYIANGTSKQWIHMPTNFNVIIPANGSYVIGMISKFSGLSLYTANNIQPMYSTTEGIFTATNWKPPSTISIQTLTTPPIFIEWFGNINSLISTSTQTSSSIVTCTSGQFCITNTTTVVQVQTTYSYSTSSGASQLNVIQDFESYFPVWIFPLIFSPFGIQGVMIGFLIGVILGVLLGIIPLWAGFLLSLGLVYVLIRR